MKRILFLTIALTAICFTGFSQQRRSFDPHKAAGQRTERMKQVLDLNETQYASVKNINEKYAEKAQSIRKESAPQAGDLRPRLQAIRAERQRELDAVLTHEQREKWSQYRSQKQKERHERIQRRKQEHAKALRETLNLSDDQALKMEQEQRAVKEKIRAVRENPALPEEAKKSEVKAIVSRHKVAIKEILSSVQYEQWKSMKEKKRALRQEHHFRKRQ